MVEIANKAFDKHYLKNPKFCEKKKKKTRLSLFNGVLTPKCSFY